MIQSMHQCLTMGGGSMGALLPGQIVAMLGRGDLDPDHGGPEGYFLSLQCDYRESQWGGG